MLVENQVNEGGAACLQAKSSVGLFVETEVDFLLECPAVCRHGAAADAVPLSALPRLLMLLHVTQNPSKEVQVPEKEDDFHN